MFLLTDKIHAPSRLTAEQAWQIAKAVDAARPEFTKEMLFEMARLCKTHGWDFANMFAQSANETGNFKSALYRERGNPGGIGKTGTDVSTGQDVSRTYTTGEQAARAMAVHTHAYVDGPIEPDDELHQYIYLDPRYHAVLNGRDVQNGDPLAGSVKTLGDWNVNGRWAQLVNSRYGDNIVNRGNELIPDVTTPSTPEEPIMTPESLVTFIEAPVTKQRDRQGFNYGTREIIGIVQHETQGRGSGPWYRDFFSCPDGERCEDALVDYLIDREGRVYRFQDPFTSNRIPWASGGTPNRNNAIGKAVNDKYGNVNKYYAAVEMVKTDSEHLTPAQIESAGRLTAYIMAKCGYPANDWKYPDKLGGNIATSCDHNDLSLTTCEMFPDDRAAFEKITTQLLVAYYEGSGSTPDPETPPTKPTGDDVVLVPGIDVGIAKVLWGKKFPKYVYTKGGPLSMLWENRAKAEGMWPSLEEQPNYADGRRYFIFRNGWVALDPPGDDPDEKVRWVDREPVQ